MSVCGHNVGLILFPFISLCLLPCFFFFYLWHTDLGTLGMVWRGGGGGGWIHPQVLLKKGFLPALSHCVVEFK